MQRKLLLAAAAVVVLAGCGGDTTEEAGGSGDGGRLADAADLPLDYSGGTSEAGMFPTCGSARRIAERAGTLTSASYESNEGGGTFVHVMVKDADAAALVNELTRYVGDECRDDYRATDGPDLGAPTHWWTTTNDWPVALVQTSPSTVHYYLRTGVGQGREGWQNQILEWSGPSRS